MDYFNMIIPSTVVVALLSFLSLFIISKSLAISKSAKSYSHIPGPTKLPLIGNLHLMLRAAAAPHHMFRDLSAKYGPLMHLQLGELHFLIISSTDFTKEVVKTHDVNFANRPRGPVPDALTYNYSDVGFAPYGEYWRQLRKICTLELLSSKRVRSFRPIRVEENMNLAKWIASCEGSAANLSEKLYLSSYDAITRATVGSKTNERGTMVSVIQEATKLASGFSVADFYPSIKSLPLITGLRFKIQRMYSKLDTVLESIIEQHRSERATATNTITNNDNTIEDLADVLLRIQADDTTPLALTTDNIKAVLLNMFVAGTDTSPTTVEWAMSEMIRNPATLNKAQEEVRRVFDEGGYIDEDKFMELKYLKLVMKETLRLHPPVPLLIPRENSESCEINGYAIPAKTRVIINAWALGRDPRYWEEAEKFKPERFEERIDFKGSNLEFIPFGAGRRICAGMTLGMVNVEYTLAMLLYHFDWMMPIAMGKEMGQQQLDMSETFGSTIRRKHHLLLIPIVKRPLHA